MSEYVFNLLCNLHIIGISKWKEHNHTRRIAFKYGLKLQSHIIFTQVIFFSPATYFVNLEINSSTNIHIFFFDHMQLIFLYLALRVPAQRVAVSSSFLLSRRPQGTWLQTQWASASLYIAVSLLCCKIFRFLQHTFYLN